MTPLDNGLFRHKSGYFTVVHHIQHKCFCHILGMVCKSDLLDIHGLSDFEEPLAPLTRTQIAGTQFFRSGSGNTGRNDSILNGSCFKESNDAGANSLVHIGIHETGMDMPLLRETFVIFVEKRKQYAAVNGGENGAQYQVGEMDPAELDRWTVYDIEPSVEDWLNWANGKVDPILWDFINAERAHLEHGGEHEPNKVYPSRRSWVRFNGVGTSANVFKQGADLNVLFNLAMGFVGFEAAIKLRDFVNNYQYQVSVEDLIDRGQIDRTSSWGINDHSAMVEKLTASGIFSEADWSQDRIVNLAEYFIALPSEVALKLWAVMGAANNIDLVKAIHPLIADQIVKLIKVES